MHPNLPQELAWTCHSLTRVSLHGCRAITHKSLKALGDAPNLTSVDLSGARGSLCLCCRPLTSSLVVTINGFVTLCSKAAKRIREINLNGMLYHRTEPEPAPGSNFHSPGCMPFVQAAIRLCHGLQVLRCVDAVPVLPVSRAPPRRHLLSRLSHAPQHSEGGCTSWWNPLALGSLSCLSAATGTRTGPACM